ncbi:MMPL family transporter [Yinghuangia sp. KLBMP8922]|uniref:MMPL family transporter n=1 Tax=Yinghuangia soli TaxID=2908204 RepID=A0AA41U2A7_9ACTN|nr:MMPL family transporter [Yinghuangia soli]MCF2528422.1 MMPL family transporter [Yinghuangia soli]
MAGFAHRRKWAALVLWILVLAGVQASAVIAGNDYREDYSLPGTQSQRAADLLAEHGAARAADTVPIVLAVDAERGAVPSAGLRDAAVRDQVTRMLAQVARTATVTGVRSPFDDPSAISADGRIGYATVSLSVPAKEMTKADAQGLHDAVTPFAGEGLRIELGGDVGRLLAAGEGGLAEGAGLLAALVILVLMFGTVLAAGLPVVTAVFAVGSTLAAVVLASHVFTIADWTPYVMMLVGLGVGIDYALLIFARFRSELLRGRTPRQANVIALDAAGRSVFVAGCTVIVALLGLVALGLGSLRGMALSVALTVLVTMLAALTLLPALLAVFGDRFARTFRAKHERRTARRGPVAEGAVWRRLARRVQRRPLLALLTGLLSLGALALPALDLRLGFADAGNDAPGTTSRKAYDLLSEGFGPGFNGPLIVVAESGTGDAATPLRSAAAALTQVPGVTALGPVTPIGDGSIATVMVFPSTSPQAEETSRLATRLRDGILPDLASETGTTYLLGGTTAAAQDYADKVAGRMPLFVLIVVGLSILLLMIVFGSLLVPLKAAFFNLLSIAAALGAMVLVFQYGMFGIEPAPIEAFLPVMVFAIVFGLSMDYEIFLVARMREEWRRTGNPTEAVREGLAHTGSVITAAGAIMIAVFGAVMLSPDRLLQQTGFGMAVAVFVDAVIIRCLLVPATMHLLGRRAWWLPRPLSRLLPHVEVER